MLSCASEQSVNLLEKKNFLLKQYNSKYINLILKRQNVILSFY